MGKLGLTIVAAVFLLGAALFSYGEHTETRFLWPRLRKPPHEVGGPPVHQIWPNSIGPFTLHEPSFRPRHAGDLLRPLPPGTLDYDLQEDMLAVARSVAERETATPQEIEEDTALSPERLSIAAECLQYEDKRRLVKFHDRGPYGFNEATTTTGTLRFVRSNQA